VINYNYTTVNEVRAVNIDPRKGVTRNDGFVAIQEAFFEYEYRINSDRYDFDDVRVGIQPFISDFRGFLFQDQPFGVRFFGTHDNNQWQYNAGWFRRLEKDTNSGLNDVFKRPRDDDVFFANLYRQDFMVPGFTLQGTVVFNSNRETANEFLDNNGFQVRPAVLGDARPRSYNVLYLGMSGDGHFGRWNTTGSLYYAHGHDDHNQISQNSARINAFLAAAEVSRDFDWVRVRGSALYSSGDKDPYDGKQTGFDAILENPQFAGADTSFWIRQAVPLIGGGGVALSGRNGVLPSLRSSKDQGQSNFTNPGLALIGIGADVDITPHWRAIANVNQLWFNNTSSLSVLRNQGDIDRGQTPLAGFQHPQAVLIPARRVRHGQPAQDDLVALNVHEDPAARLVGPPATGGIGLAQSGHVLGPPRRHRQPVQVAAVLRRQRAEERRTPAGIEAVRDIEGAEAPEPGVDEEQFIPVVIGHLVDVDVAGDMDAARQVAGVVLAQGLELGRHGGDVAVIPDGISAADGEPGAVRGDPHGFAEAAEMGVEHVTVRAQHDELARLVGGDHETDPELSKQRGEVRGVDAA